ncbi:zinc ABC transporter substrate-binding protein ZnuA [Arsenophonus nasoniae]|uniref:High-affinity zinc uptake system protein ZnuA n=1 Tax=Arsenophonus nasoniae TaxID=638 RepID=D2TXY2_9GAMM|nr:zinc ABC transporter substrate-binding protein ZnuA [Arsenophonus nasoniae]QBY43270.1 High-affinity zinc uptake system protein ZnuA [Arsenophonus nasoniae]WGM07284.1 zinc ABC transporter substrate-binding protein ZnuA [Arsenophonus nasoniae]WGM12161.1 zinc ABC transporter substrate-binding protein ZnuA [Arsenophonus nasoniae]WGM16843.1 zinc ABC transporter substrate-binding protein ZnuA [Arsenophonus nasoniae]CBA72262.1 high-affinity zinc uptake system substrate-binding protein [Arsenophonu
MLHKTKKIVQKIMGKKRILAGLLFSFLSTAHADVVTSIRPLGFIAAAITNGVTDVKILLPDGASPHDYSLKPSDLEKIKTADLFIWVGSDMETFLEKPLAQLPTQKRIALTNDPAIKTRLLKSSDEGTPVNSKSAHDHDHHHNVIHNHHSHGEYNMHIWLSPDIARIAANIIHHRLVVLYPKYKNQLDVNLRKFDEKLTQTDKNIAKMLQSVGDKRYFVFHDAYSYFEKRYHLDSLGYFTINPIIQPGAQRLYQIRTMLAQKKAVCVFAEPQFRPAVIKAVIKDTDVRMGTLDPLGSGIGLSKDSYVEFLTALSNQFKSCLDKN